MVYRELAVEEVGAERNHAHKFMEASRVARMSASKTMAVATSMDVLRKAVERMGAALTNSRPESEYWAV